MDRDRGWETVALTGAPIEHVRREHTRNRRMAPPARREGSIRAAPPLTREPVEVHRADVNDSGGGYRIGPDAGEVYGLATARELERGTKPPRLETGRWPSGRVAVRAVLLVVALLIVAGWVLTATHGQL